MLKITSEKDSNSARFTLEGSLTGPWISELEQEWRSTEPSGTVRLVVDLRGAESVIRHLERLEPA